MAAKSQFPLTVHHYRRDPRTNARVLHKVTPYIAISTREGRLFVRDGKVWDAGGTEMTNPPAWFWEEWAKIHPERRKAFGIPHDAPPKKKEAA